MEWSSEKLNEFGEIVGETFSKKLSDLELLDTLLLWDSARTDQEGFARVERKKLPNKFSNGKKIPVKFKKELRDLYFQTMQRRV